MLSVRNECRELLHDNRAFTLEECEAWFDREHPDFRLILRDGTPIGYFRLTRDDSSARSLYVGADLQPSVRELGLGRAIYERFLPTFAREFGVTEVKLEVLSHNERALRLYRSLGFRETGRDAGAFVRDGRRVDNVKMSLGLA